MLLARAGCWNNSRVASHLGLKMSFLFHRQCPQGPQHIAENVGTTKLKNVAAYTAHVLIPPSKAAFARKCNPKPNGSSHYKDVVLPIEDNKYKTVSGPSHLYNADPNTWKDNLYMERVQSDTPSLEKQEWNKIASFKRKLGCASAMLLL